MRILDKHAKYEGGKSVGDGSTGFVGCEIGNYRFVEHSDSITARKKALSEGDATVEPYYAMWGSGMTSRYDKRTKTLSELQSMFGPATMCGRI